MFQFQQSQEMTGVLVVGRQRSCTKCANHVRLVSALALPKCATLSPAVLIVINLFLHERLTNFKNSTA